MVVMLTTLMQPVVDGVSHSQILAVRIRLFLNAVEEFEMPMRRKKQTMGSQTLLNQ
jgi:hypothetical protein